jgi:YidC/Oxa1 family membrane protein insertase
VIVGGFLSPIEDVLHNVLEWLHGTIGLPWAWAIVALTLVVRMIILPLTVQQIHSMQRLSQYAPEMKEIQRKYKEDKQRQQQELMKFYKEKQINPLASCLPLLLQFPVFIALYYVLRDFARSHPSGSLSWLHIVPSIADNVTDHWSGYLLLAIYVASQVSSTYFMATTMDKTQRRIMMALPLFFVIFIFTYSFPTGLVLYWVTTNLWTVGQGLVTRRLVPKPPPPERRTSRTPPKDDGTAGDGAKQKPPSPKPAPAAAVAPSRSSQPRKVKRKKRSGRR